MKHTCWSYTPPIGPVNEDRRPPQERIRQGYHSGTGSLNAPAEVNAYGFGCRRENATLKENIFSVSRMKSFADMERWPPEADHHGYSAIQRRASARPTRITGDTVPGVLSVQVYGVRHALNI